MAPGQVTKKVSDLLETYDRVMEILKLNMDHYLKRTQILMILIQSALFVAFTKLVTKLALAKLPLAKPAQHGFLALTKLAKSLYSSAAGDNALLLVSFVAIPILGAVSAYAWATFINRQHGLFEFCRTYLRGVEYQLAKLGMPLAYFHYESTVFYHSGSRREQKYVSFGPIKSDKDHEKQAFPSFEPWENEFEFPHFRTKVKYQYLGKVIL